MGFMPSRPNLRCLAILILFSLAACTGGRLFEPAQTAVTMTEIPGGTLESETASADSVPRQAVLQPQTAASTTPYSHTPLSPETTAPPARENPQYTLTATLDYARHFLSVDET